MKSKKLTVQELFEIVWDEHWNTERFQNSGYAKEVKANYLNHINEIFGAKKLSLVKRKAVREWHQALKKHPVAANRSLEVLSRMFSYAAEKDWVEQTENPCLFIKSHKERKRRRYATEAEIAKIGDLLSRNYNDAPRGVTFLFTLLYSGARPRSLERARWQDLQIVDGGYGLLTADGKSTAETGEPESVLIPPQILEMMNALPRRIDGLIFGILIPRHLWYRIRREAGCPDLWARDLRRTFATVGMSNGIKMDTISELLNHKSVQTTKIYAKLNDVERIKSVGIISDKISQILNKKAGGQ